MIYKFKPGSGFAGDAKATYIALEKVRAQNDGQLIPDEVVKAAWLDSSPLHSHFEWDDHVAAQKYRKGRARKLIRSVEIVEESGRDRDRMPVFINVIVKKSGKRIQYYQNIKTATATEFDSALLELNRQAIRLSVSAGKLERFAKTKDQLARVAEVKNQTERLVATLAPALG